MQTRSQMSEAFGADVELKSTGTVLCLVIGRISPISAVNAVNGSIVTIISQNRVLALVDIVFLSNLRGHRDVVLAGPVSIDPQRFAQFARLVGVQST